jgi:anaerobic dimethyl sulfoxide reductase subunit B (iron-sulfur subunit)
MEPMGEPSAYAFHFDSSSCSGCKACQVACKDRNGLEEGVLWRRVYEVSGGGWTLRGGAWIADVFAYYLSVGCNHCAEPICMEVCPARAFSRREDGVVLLDSDRCLGCHYCAWSCPYGAPQYDERHRRMTKCSFCVEDLDRGLPPACVAACPMRALHFGRVDELNRRFGEESARDPYPLPARAVTRPSHIVQSHVQAERARPGSARIGNREEVGT